MLIMMNNFSWPQCSALRLATVESGTVGPAPTGHGAARARYVPTSRRRERAMLHKFCLILEML